MMVGVHHHLESARCIDPLTVHGLPHRIDIGGASLGHGINSNLFSSQDAFGAEAVAHLGVEGETRVALDLQIKRCNLSDRGGTLLEEMIDGCLDRRSLAVCLDDPITIGHRRNSGGYVAFCQLFDHRP